MRQSRSGRLTFNGTEILVLYIQSYIYFYRNVVCHLNDFLLYSWPGLYIFHSCPIFLYPFRIRNIQKRHRSPPFRTPHLLPQNHPLQKLFRLPPRKLSPSFLSNTKSPPHFLHLLPFLSTLIHPP